MFILILVLFVVVGGALTVVTVLNLINQAHLSLFGLAVDLPVGLLFLAAFLLGALFLYIVAFLSAIHDQREIRKLKARLAELERSMMSPPPSSSGPLQATGPIMPIPMPGMQSNQQG